MAEDRAKYEHYFSHLQKISFLGRSYKRFFSSPILFFCARRFGRRIIEVGSGIGSGVLGAFPKRVIGLEINPVAVDYCRSLGLDVHLISESGNFPVQEDAYDSCILDNVLEHIADPAKTLDECYRITRKGGGLIIAVPGLRGFDSDVDHKKFYDKNNLRLLHAGWLFVGLFSAPFIFTSKRLSKSVKQYCLVATYKKI